MEEQNVEAGAGEHIEANDAKALIKELNHLINVNYRLLEQLQSQAKEIDDKRNAELKNFQERTGEQLQKLATLVGRAEIAATNMSGQLTWTVWVGAIATGTVVGAILRFL